MIGFLILIQIKERVKKTSGYLLPTTRNDASDGRGWFFHRRNTKENKSAQLY